MMDLQTSFPILRWVAAVWMAVWFPAYALIWGWANFLHLCNSVVILTCAGIWTGNRLLLSSQAVATLFTVLFWDLDFGWRLVTGDHLFGGTEYMWENEAPLGVRLLSLYHIVWPFLLVWLVRRVGYDRRGLALQSAIAAALLVVSRFVLPEENINFSFLDPVFHRAWGPAPVHLAVVALTLIGVLYWPAHRVLARFFSQT